MFQTWHACRLSKTFVKDANEVVKRGTTGWSPSTLQAEPSGSAIGSFWKVEERSFVKLDEIVRDPERDSSISIEFLS